MVACRPGHSLPELVVATTLLAATFGAVTAAAIHALGATTDAVRRQEAAAAAAAVLDSLIATPAPGAGSAEWDRTRVEWWVQPVGTEGRHVAVRVLPAPGHRDLARVEGFWMPVPPALPEP